MTHYRSNRRDIEFNLFEDLKVGEYYGEEPFACVDEEIERDARGEGERLTTEGLASKMGVADRNPPELVEG